MASEATITIGNPQGERLGLEPRLPGAAATLCKGCGHNSITSHLIEACKSIGVNPYQTVKLSGIGCSSKTPAYFLQYSHGFNALHGRMPSVATGALLANQQAAAHRHQRRRRHGQHRPRPVQARLPAQPADGLHRRGQRLLRPDQGPVLGHRRPPRPPPPRDRRGERSRRSTSAWRRSPRAPRSWPGRSPATRSSSSPCSRPPSSTGGRSSSTSSARASRSTTSRRLDQELGLGQGARGAAPGSRLRAVLRGHQRRFRARHHPGSDDARRIRSCL